MLNSRTETQSSASAESKILGLSTLVIEQGLEQRKGCSSIHFFNPVRKLWEWNAVNFIMNQFMNKFNLLHVEVYQNEISRRLPTVLFSVICCYCSFYRDWKLLCELKVRDEKGSRIAQVCNFLCLKFLISAGENLDKKVMPSLPNKITINLISVRLSRSIYLIQSWLRLRKN